MTRTRLLYIGIVTLLFSMVRMDSVFAENSFDYFADGQSGMFILEAWDYVDNINQVQYIDIGAKRTLIFDYHLGIELNNDVVEIYSINNFGIETLLQSLTGAQVGSVSTNIPSGRAKIVFRSNSSISFVPSNLNYWGVNILFHAGEFDISTQYGWIRTGVKSDYKAHFETDATAFLFEEPILVTSSLGAATGSLTLKTSNAARMTILSDGKVGIGTSNPSSRLHILQNNDTEPMATLTLQGTTGALYLPGERNYIGRLRFTTRENQVVGSIRGYYSGAIGAPNHYPYGNLIFYVGNADNVENESMRIVSNGNIGIGTNNPLYKLDVKGTIRAAEVKVVPIDQFADYVFDKEYKLPKLTEVHQYIQTNGHLPEIPSAAEVKENGLNLVEMQVKLLKKIEELTLYVIEQQNQIEELKRYSKKKSN